jgi:hypothetical protein
MIRINLLGLPRQKKGKRGAAVAAEPDMPGQGPSALIFLVMGLIVGGGVLFYLYNGANSKATQVASDLVAANQKGAQLATVKT